MELSQVILGPVVTEKAERLKAADVHKHTLRVHPHATKIDVKNALHHFYDLQIKSVRIVKVGPKTRALQDGTETQKRHPFKKAIVTLAPKSKPLDLASFHVNS